MSKRLMGTLTPDQALDQFWAQALGAPLVILSDFDFTITQVDVGDLICHTLAPYPPTELSQFAQGQIGSRLLWQASMAKVELPEAEALADQVAIDPGFKAFAQWAADQGIPLAVVSDGFTFYIERILRREGLDHLPVFANQYVKQGELAFPHTNTACDFCGCCKAAVARRLQQSGAHVLYLGDGVSDLYATGFSDWVFAKGRLAKHMRENQAPFFSLEQFDQVLGLVQGNLERFQDGSMERRNSLTAHQRCQFETIA